LHPGHTTDVWRLLPEPVSKEELTDRRLAVVARTPDVEKAKAALDGRFAVLPYRFMEPALAADTALLSAVLTGATLLVLLCAAVNSASLLLSRGNARRRDLAVKLALGASRGRLAKQLLLESALVGAAGGIAGLLFAHWTTTIVPSLFAPEHAEMLEAGLSPAIIVTTLAGSILLGTALGAMPALYGTAPITLLDLRGDAGTISETGRGSRLQTALVVGQIALSTVLLLASLLLNRSLTRALEGDLGPAARNVVVATISEGEFSFRPVQGQRDYAVIIGQAMKLQHVTAAGYIATLPLQRTNRAVFGLEAKPGVIEKLETDTNVVSFTYFGAMNTGLIEGRFFGAGDSGLAPQVAIINDIAMRRHFGESAIGRRLIDERGDPIEIVGVIHGGRYRAMQEAPAPMVYRPLSQIYVPRMHLVMRTTGPPDPRMYQLMRMSLRAGRMELMRIASLDDHLAESLVLDRLAAALVSACGLMALVLAVVGAYSLMLDSVQRRTREIGLRIALGASALRIGRSIFAFGIGLTATGVVIGLATVLALERMAKTFILGLPAVDIATMAITAGVLAMVVSLAAILPARRALRVSPTVALRHT
jgi:predicted permease